jgi:hypothetical protein
VLQSDQTGDLSKYIWACHNYILHVTATCILCTESTFFWMRQDNIGRKGPRSLLCQCRLEFWIFLFLRSVFVNLSQIYDTLFFLIFKHSFSFVCSEPSVVLDVKAFLTVVSVNVLLFFFKFLLFCIRSRKFSNVLCGSRMCCYEYFWSWWWSFGKIIKIAESLLLLSESAASAGGAALSGM